MSLRRHDFRPPSRNDDESYPNGIRRGGVTPRAGEKRVALRVGRKGPICVVLGAQRIVFRYASPLRPSIWALSGPSQAH